MRPRRRRVEPPQLSVVCCLQITEGIGRRIPTNPAQVSRMCRQVSTSSPHRGQRTASQVVSKHRWQFGDRLRPISCRNCAEPLQPSNQFSSASCRPLRLCPCWRSVVGTFSPSAPRTSRPRSGRCQGNLSNALLAMGHDWELKTRDPRQVTPWETGPFVPTSRCCPLKARRTAQLSSGGGPPRFTPGW